MNKSETMFVLRSVVALLWILYIYMHEYEGTYRFAGAIQRLSAWPGCDMTWEEQGRTVKSIWLSCHAYPSRTILFFAGYIYEPVREAATHSTFPTMTIPVSSSPDFEFPRPKDVGVLAMEMYFPRRVRLQRLTLPHVLTPTPSASPNLTSKCSIVFPRENIP